jgi:hypothetical protein
VAEMAKIGFSDVRRALTWGMRQAPVPHRPGEVFLGRHQKR